MEEEEEREGKETAAFSQGYSVVCDSLSCELVYVGLLCEGVRRQTGRTCRVLLVKRSDCRTDVASKQH